MIEKATEERLEDIRQTWKLCFPDEDPRYTEYFFKNIYKPENCYLNVVEGKVVSTLVRNPHTIMFNDRVLATSMIVGCATLPSEQKNGYMKQLMETVIDACENSELITLIQTENPELYEPYGFRNIYRRKDYILERKDVKSITNFGCAYEPSPIDLLKVYSAFIRRFNGFYPRDLEYYKNYKKQISALGGKFVAYYDGNNQIRGYAVMIPQGKELRVEELIYLDSMSLMKLCNAALQERRIIHLLVSDAEDFSKVFPEAKVKTFDSTMVRLNDAKLFSRIFNTKVNSVQEAFALSNKPLNLNEWD